MTPDEVLKQLNDAISGLEANIREGEAKVYESLERLRDLRKTKDHGELLREGEIMVDQALDAIRDLRECKARGERLRDEMLASRP